MNDGFEVIKNNLNLPIAVLCFFFTSSEATGDDTPKIKRKVKFKFKTKIARSTYSTDLI